jgi:sulfopropanediol 3-dehydrogenase
MERWLKHGADQDTSRAADATVRGTVEAILVDIGAPGDAAVRKLPVRVGGWERDSYRSSEQEIKACLSELSMRDIEDIGVAQAQRDALRDGEVETVPGVVLGHRNIPVGSAGCPVPGGNSSGGWGSTVAPARWRR